MPLYPRYEKLTWLLLLGTIIGSVVWWFQVDFRRASAIYYLPFLTVPFAIFLVWLSSEVRTRRAEALWNTATRHFDTKSYPTYNIEFKKHSVGEIEVDRTKIGIAVAVAREDGIFFRAALYKSRLDEKYIPWTIVARLTYLATKRDPTFGNGSLGFALVRFKAPALTDIVIPWRETFETSIPASVAFESKRKTGT